MNTVDWCVLTGLVSLVTGFLARGWLDPRLGRAKPEPKPKPETAYTVHRICGADALEFARLYDQTITAPSAWASTKLSQFLMSKLPPDAVNHQVKFDRSTIGSATLLVKVYDQ